MAKQSRKQYFNELHRELTFTGPILCRAKFDLYVYRSCPPEVSGWSAMKLPAKSHVILFRGPLPGGGHRSAPHGASWLLFSMVHGAVRLENTYSNFDTLFEKI